MTRNNHLPKKRKIMLDADYAVSVLKNQICTGCPVRTECGAQKKEDQLGSLIMCIVHGPVDYCDEDYFTEVPILGDPRFMGQRERDE